MTNNQHFYDALVRISLRIFSHDFTQFLPHNVNLSAHVENLNRHDMHSQSVQFNILLDENGSMCFVVSINSIVLFFLNKKTMQMLLTNKS